METEAKKKKMKREKGTKDHICNQKMTTSSLITEGKDSFWLTIGVGVITVFRG